MTFIRDYADACGGRINSNVENYRNSHAQAIAEVIIRYNFVLIGALCGLFFGVYRTAGK